MRWLQTGGGDENKLKTANEIACIKYVSWLEKTYQTKTTYVKYWHKPSSFIYAAYGIFVSVTNGIAAINRKN